MRIADHRHDDLGMNEPISRRDFLNGAVLAGAGLLLPGKAPAISPADAFNGYGGVGDYRHSNGNTWDVLSAGHALRDGMFEQRVAKASDTGETYDFVAVGGGISGLAAAIFFQQYQGGRALVIDNHPIFGGEAKRNEFLVDGQRLTAHQGSAIFLVPKQGGYADRFYKMIGMDRSSFDYQTWRGPSAEMPLSHSPYDTPMNYGFYFGPQFGQRPGVWVMDPWRRRLQGAPISESVKAELLRWGTNRVDVAGPTAEGDAISRQLDSMTLEDHVMARYDISRETVRRFLSPVEGGGYSQRAARRHNLRERSSPLQNPSARSRHGRRQLDDPAHRPRPAGEPPRSVRAVLSVAVPDGEHRRAELALALQHGIVRLPLVRRSRRLSLRAQDGAYRERAPDDQSGLTNGVDHQGPVRTTRTPDRRAGGAWAGEAARHVVRAVRTRVPRATRGHVRAWRLRSASRHRRDHSQSLGTRVRESAAGVLLRRQRQPRAEGHSARSAARSDRLCQYRSRRRQ